MGYALSGLGAGRFDDDETEDAAVGQLDDLVRVERGNGDGTFEPGSSVSFDDPIVIEVVHLDEDTSEDILVGGKNQVAAIAMLAPVPLTLDSYPLPNYAFEISAVTAGAVTQVLVTYVVDWATTEADYLIFDSRNGFELIAHFENVYSSSLEILSEGGVGDIIVSHVGSIEIHRVDVRDPASMVDSTSVDFVDAAAEYGSIEAGDYDGDGISDLALLGSSGIEWLQGAGDGNFEDRGSIALGGAGDPVEILNLWPDREGTGCSMGVAVGFANPDVVRAFSPSAEGLMPRATVDLGSPFTTLAIGDFGGDGVPDVAALRETGEFVYTLSVFEGTTEDQ